MNDDNSKPYTTLLDLNLKDQLKADLINQGFELSTPAYTIFSAKKKGVVCTLYQSGKLVVQGKDKSEFLEFYLEPQLLKKFDFTHPTINLDLKAKIGIDESGKGDFFGPLCIAGVFAEGEEIKELKKLGICDSKTLSDKKIHILAEKIKKDFTYHIVKINPLKYNELYLQFGNLNTLLAWGHATAIEQLVLKTNCKEVLIDQFADERVVIQALKRKKMEVNLSQRHRAEEDVVVAAASILARDTFLLGLKFLGEEIGFPLPKGASQLTINMGKKIVEKHGVDALQKLGKLHFKTYQMIKNLC